MQHTPIRGIIAYPVTPFLANDSGIDEPAFHRVLEALLSTDPAAIAILGSAGESAYLREDEWRRAVELGVEAVAGVVPLIVGISELTTDAAVAKAKFAEEAGADRLMVIPISYWKLDQAEIYSHFKAVASATKLPIMIYNNPATSGVDMPPALMVRMVEEIDGIDLIKESSGDIHRMHAIRELSGGTIPFYNGANHLALEALAAGAHGWCTAAPNLLGSGPAELVAHIEAGELEQARTLFYRLLPVLRFIVHGGLPTTVKAGLRLNGLEVGDPRRPLLPLSGERLEELRGLLAAQ
ncbi:MAG: dihydrodipicolinate synthase family protein [Altererythrobacter sp.]|nr:dihydrodipicolinate synthase family protein [Altererythrobacter sp.]